MAKRTIAPTNVWYILKTLFSKSQPFTIWPKSLNTLQCNGWIIRFLHNYLKKILNPLVFNKLTRVAIYPQKTKTLNWILACVWPYIIYELWNKFSNSQTQGDCTAVYLVMTDFTGRSLYNRSNRQLNPMMIVTVATAFGLIQHSRMKFIKLL